MVDKRQRTANARIWVHTHFETHVPIQFTASWWCGDTDLLDIFLETDPSNIDYSGKVEEDILVKIIFDYNDENFLYWYVCDIEEINEDEEKDEN